MFQIMMCNYIINPDPERNCLVHSQDNPTTVQMLVTRQKLKGLNISIHEEDTDISE